MKQNTARPPFLSRLTPHASRVTRHALQVLCVALLLTGCTTYQGVGPQTPQARHQSPAALRNLNLSPELEQKILSLDPEHVTKKEIKETLAQAPAPRILNIRGGIYPVYLAMANFSQFLIGMGYPETAIRNPADGAFSLSCYQDSDQIAGLTAWYYEQEGMRPMMIGHSQGGMQAVKVVRTLASTRNLRVRNPITHTTEKRADIIDPLTGQKRPAHEVQFSYVSVVSAGGLTRFLPNQWSMTFTLRKIPDSTVDFTGFSKGSDPLGGDFFGIASANTYRSVGKTVRVRNVRLPSNYNHALIPNTKHLLESPAMIAWVDAYNPADKPDLNVKFEGNSEHIVWAADVWYDIKKHWVIELQRLIQAKRVQAQTQTAKP